MAFPYVDPATTDLITKTNVQVLGLAPAIAMSNLYVATSLALAQSAANAAKAQAETNKLAEQVTQNGISILTAATKKAMG